MKKSHIIVLFFLVFLISSCGTESSGWEFGIKSIEPQNGATNVPLNQVITVTFNNDLNWSTVVAANFYVVVTQTGVQVPGNITAAFENTILFTPASQFSPNTSYTIYMNALLEDIWGNFFEGGVTSSFTTTQ